MQDFNDTRELRVKEEILFENFARDFLQWDSAWIQAQHADGHAFGHSHADMRQGHMDNYLIRKWRRMFLSEIDDPEAFKK